MKHMLVVAIIIVAAMAAAFLFFRPSIAESGTHAEVAARLAKLKQDTDPKAFLGFCTCDEDALYIVYEGGVFWLDYELTTPQKKSHAEAFRKTASDLGFVVVDTTYGDFPVLRIKAGRPEARAAEVSFMFAQRIFRHDQKTKTEFLP